MKKKEALLNLATALGLENLLIEGDHYYWSLDEKNHSMVRFADQSDPSRTGWMPGCSNYQVTAEIPLDEKKFDCAKAILAIADAIDFAAVER